MPQRFTRFRDGARRQLWPIRLKWSAARSSHWFHTHGWQTGTEHCVVRETSDGCMPGFRAVFGWTLHLGRLKVCFGRNVGYPDPCEIQAPPVAGVLEFVDPS